MAKMPTTRRGRWLQRREKYLRRRRRAKFLERIRKWGDDFKQHTVGTRSLGEIGPLQSPHGLRRYHGYGLLESVSTDVLSWKFKAPPGEGPPHPVITDPFIRFIVDHYHHPSFAMIGFHKRRVPTFGKLARHKQSAESLRILRANYFFFRNGCFPSWDPAGRTPTLEDIENGAPYPPASLYGYPLDIGF